MATKKTAVKILGRNDILEAKDLKRELLDIPEWDGSVYVHTLKGSERDEFENRVVQARKKGKLDVRGVKAHLVIVCTRDENGKPIFGLNDIGVLNEKSGKAIDRIFTAAQKLSGLTDEEVEELTGNSESVPSGDSGTA